MPRIEDRLRHAARSSPALGLESARAHPVKAWRELGRMCLRAWRSVSGTPVAEEGLAAYVLIAVLPIDRAAFASLSHRRQAEFLGQAHFAGRWAELGFPTFQITHSLLAALALTDCSGLEGGDFRLPFPSFVIELPYPNSVLRLSDPKRGEVPVRWLALHQYTVLRKGDQLAEAQKIVAATLNRETSISNRVFAELVQEHGDMIPMVRIEAFAEHDLSIYTQGERPTDVADLERWVPRLGRLDGCPIEPTDIDEACQSLSARVVANLIVWLEAQKTDDEKRPVAASIPVLGQPGSNRWVVGRSVKLPRQIRDAAEQLCTRRGISGWKVRSRFIVRGHWRLQPWGPGRVMRRRRWIEPYWKGPTDGISSDRLYELAAAHEEVNVASVNVSTGQGEAP